MRKTEWMIYFNERTGHHDCAIVGSKGSYQLTGTVVGSLFGTKQEAEAMCRRRDREEHIRPVLHPDNTERSNYGYR